MNFIVYLIFGLVPSIIWLLFYLRKDHHPEPKGQVIRIFFFGMIITLPTILIERILLEAITKFEPLLSGNLFSFLYFFGGVALVEEVLKYLVVKETILKDPDFDEPIDAMLYMIIAALGLAAIENILVLYTLKEPLFIQQATLTMSARFIGATFLHALCSGLIGYFLARSFFESENKKRLMLIGFIIATALHGLFNVSIIKIGETLIEKNGKILIINPQGLYFAFATVASILIGLAIFVSWGLNNLKKIESICKIKQK